MHQQTDRDDLFAFGRALPAAQKKDLLQEALREDAPAALVCPDAWAPLSRVLVVDQGNPPDGGFLETAVELCRCFQAEPIVLTATRSEQAARLCQRAAREVFRRRGVDADFDFVAGAEVGEAVRGVARWRRCQLVVIERDAGPAWWRWLRGRAVEELLGSAEPITVLALPSRLVVG